MITRGAEPSTIHRFANTIDVEEWAAQAEIRSSRRAELRARLGANAGDCVVLSVARLVHEKDRKSVV